MADIAKCNGYLCPWKRKCYRFMAPDGLWQSYMDQPGKRIGRKWVCLYYYPNFVQEISKINDLKDKRL